MIRRLLPALLAPLLLTGCVDDPHDVTPPAAPRGLYSTTGDGAVTLRWLANTEGDVAGYRIYEAPCAEGRGCPYERVGRTAGTQFTVTGLVNGVTRYYAVAAYDESGNESDLSYEAVFDTPRPEGFGQALSSYQDVPSTSGYDFSAYTTRAWDDSRCDMFFSFNGTIYEMFVPDPANTGIQDMGWASSLDAIDYAPTSGWSPTGSVELIAGHDYVVWTSDNHFAKFRVTSVGSAVVFDWAYQVDAGNRELKIRPASPNGSTAAVVPQGGQP